MRVLMSADTVGGVWTYALDLVRALRRHDVDVVLATMGGRLSDDQREQAAAAGPAALHESALRLEWMDDPWDDVERAGEWLLELAEDELPDLVHLNSYSHGSLPWRRPVVVAGHSCVLSWWRSVRGVPAPAEWRRYRRAVASGLAAADAVVAPTQAMLGELREHYGLNGGLVIANGSSSAPAPLPKEPFVLAAGRFWDEAKNLAALDEAAAGLVWPVVVAGGGGAPRHARGLGPLPHSTLSALMARAAVFAAPARYEPFGLAALEAARAGCALVLGQIGSLREVWGEAARYVDPADPIDLRSSLERLIDDGELRAAMARRARTRSRRYTAERMGADYARLYARLREARPVAA
jgi:glycogen(starch) synthase